MAEVGGFLSNNACRDQMPTRTGMGGNAGNSIDLGANDPAAPSISMYHTLVAHLLPIVICMPLGTVWPVLQNIEDMFLLRCGAVSPRNLLAHHRPRAGRVGVNCHVFRDCRASLSFNSAPVQSTKREWPPNWQIGASTFFKLPAAPLP